MMMAMCFGTLSGMMSDFRSDIFQKTIQSLKDWLSWSWLRRPGSKGISKRLLKLSEKCQLLKSFVFEKKVRNAVFLIQKIQTFAKNSLCFYFKKIFSQQLP